MAPPRVYKDYPKTKIGLALHPAVENGKKKLALTA
jgi:hypothetical protein